MNVSEATGSERPARRGGRFVSVQDCNKFVLNWSQLHAAGVYRRRMAAATHRRRVDSPRA